MSYLRAFSRAPGFLCFHPNCINQLYRRPQMLYEVNRRLFQQGVDDEDASLYQKARNRYHLFIAKHKLKRSGYYLLEEIIDKIDYPEFFNVLDLKDTFYSWFAVTELHIWMVIVRLMEESKEGRLVRNLLVQAFWEDVEVRVKKLGASSSKKQLPELAEQLNAALIAYDEGLLSNDVVLSGALWRRLYQQDPLISLENLEILVKYVRRQVKVLDTTTKAQLFLERKIKWEPLKT